MFANNRGSAHRRGLVMKSVDLGVAYIGGILRIRAYASQHQFFFLHARMLTYICLLVCFLTLRAVVKERTSWR
jgi:hypothetical protein